MEAQTTRESLNIRIKPELRSLIDRAAEMLGKTRTDFVLEASRKAAEDTLLDQTLFTVSDESYRAFLVRLDAAPQANDRLTRAMTASAPWDSK
jgi:uncharacterized protein (DUF1778 family)